MGVRVTALDEALAFLFARTTGAWKFGLERTRALLDAVGNPDRAFPVLHVAGTNGKGSSLAMAEALLRAKGLRVAKYTSPHLVDFRERMTVDRVPITADAVVEFVDRWTPLVVELGATFFEATTVMAFDAFARAHVDVALVETGLGGRLDATNVVESVAAGVTNIGWDHREYLGHTLADIAFEKAGIFKPGRPAVIGERDPAIRDVLLRRAAEQGATPVLVDDVITVAEVEVSPRGTTATYRAAGEPGHVRLHTPLVGAHQAHNLAFTLALLRSAGPVWSAPLAQANAVLPDVWLPGRFQRSGPFLFDVAHNSDGARVLADTLRTVAPERPVWVLFCALRDKDWRDMIAALRPVADRFVVTNAPTAPESRAWDLGEVGAFLAQSGIPHLVEPAFDAAIEAGRVAPTVVVTGSFHTVGDAMARLQVSPFAT